MIRFIHPALFKSGVFLCLAFIAAGEELLVHEGPTVSVPGLATLGPDGRQNAEPPDLHFIKQFFTDGKNLTNDFDRENKKTDRISATRAIELVLSALEKDYGAENLKS